MLDSYTKVGDAEEAPDFGLSQSWPLQPADNWRFYHLSIYLSRTLPLKYIFLVIYLFIYFAKGFGFICSFVLVP